MGSKKHLVISTVLLIGAVSLLYFLARGLKIDQSKPQSILIGRAAPVMSLRWLQGKDLVVHSHSGNLEPHLQQKPLVINFWASWCLSCRQEAHLLEKLWASFKNELTVIGVAVHDKQLDALDFARKFGKTYPLGLDPQGRTSIDYGVTGVPETFIVDKTGIVRFRQIGAVTTEFLTKIESLL